MSGQNAALAAVLAERYGPPVPDWHGVYGVPVDLVPAEWNEIDNEDSEDL